MARITIDHPHNEASALLGIQNRELLDARGWDLGFWTISDEKAAQQAVAALGRSARNGDWEVVPLRIASSPTKPTEDCETLSRAGSWIYVIGSHFGRKKGPLEPRRHFILRFNEALVEVKRRNVRAEAEVVRRPFVLHRLVNDAFASYGVELFEPKEMNVKFIKATRKRGETKRKVWRDLVKDDDAPLNIEGSTFLPGGHLLLGLRYPVTRGGHPILVEVEGIDRLFADGTEDPQVVGIRIAGNVGTRAKPAGVRELDSLAGDVHLITGSIDIVDMRAPGEHWTVPLAPGERGVSVVKGKRVRRFGASARVEGMAIAGDRVWYAYDDKKIVLEEAALEG